MQREKITSFTKLIKRKKGHKLVLNTYQITQGFPKEELFVLTSQIRRCAISVTSNIAEGFSRRTKKEKVNFYHISLGSLTELQNQLLVARDINYIHWQQFDKIANQTVEVCKLLNGLIKSAEMKLA